MDWCRSRRAPADARNWWQNPATSTTDTRGTQAPGQAPAGRRWVGGDLHPLTAHLREALALIAGPDGAHQLMRVGAVVLRAADLADQRACSPR